MWQGRFRIEQLIVVVTFFTLTLVVGCSKQSDQPSSAASNSLPSGPPNVREVKSNPSGSPSLGELLKRANWKNLVFGELEFITEMRNRNMFIARLQRKQPESSVQLSLGSTTLIPVLDVLKDEMLEYPEALAVIHTGSKFSAVSENGSVFVDLDSINMLPATKKRIHEIFSKGALHVENKEDEGMYEGIVVVFPASCLPLRSIDEVKSRFRGLLIELILDKIKRMTGKGSENFEARFHSYIVAESQEMMFFTRFPLFIAENSDKSLDILKALQFMIDPEAARRAEESAEYVALNHEGLAGRVEAVDKNDQGIQIIIQTELHRHEYTGVLATNLKVGDAVAPNQLIGLIKNPRWTGPLN